MFVDFTVFERLGNQHAFYAKVHVKDDTILHDALTTALTKYAKTKAKGRDQSNPVPESVDLLKSRVKSVTCGAFDLEDFIDDEEGFVTLLDSDNCPIKRKGIRVQLNPNADTNPTKDKPKECINDKLNGSTPAEVKFLTIPI